LAAETNFGDIGTCAPLRRADFRHRLPDPTSSVLQYCAG